MVLTLERIVRYKEMVISDCQLMRLAPCLAGGWVTSGGKPSKRMPHTGLPFFPRPASLSKSAVLRAERSLAA